ncbi:MAG: Tricarboxylate transport protein TctC, partial [uncultured Rubrobacteraceae bacterium]
EPPFRNAPAGDPRRGNPGGRRGEGPNLSGSAHQAGCRLLRRRPYRRHRARRRAGHVGGARPACRRREQDGRERADRDRSRRPRGAGRPHVDGEHALAQRQRGPRAAGALRPA